MKLPFTVEQLFSVFELYNKTVWPMQIVFFLLAIFLVILIMRRSSWVPTFSAFALALIWFWMGMIYHIVFFSSINPAAMIFGLLFITQSALFVYTGLIKHKIKFRYQNKRNSILGFIFITYSLVIYPILGYLFGHSYPQSPTFGVPCPTTIFTFGVLLFSDLRFPLYLMVIPVIWSIIGFFAAINLRVFEDFGLFIAGILSAIVFFSTRHRISA